jgi:hypothetical protein
MEVVEALYEYKWEVGGLHYKYVGEVREASYEYLGDLPSSPPLPSPYLSIRYSPHLPLFVGNIYHNGIIK